MGDHKESGMAFRDRILCSVVFIPILLILIHLEWKIPFTLLVCAIVLFGLREYFRIFTLKNIRGNRLAVYVGGGLFPFLFATGFLVYPALWLFILLPGLFVFYLTRPRGVDDAALNMAVSLMGIVYCSWLPSHLAILREMPQGSRLVLFVFAVTWIGDSLAYILGRKFGRRKIAPSISPHKSVEGLFAGLSGSVLAAFLFLVILKIPRDYYLFYLASGLILGIMSVLGDLSESLIKRSLRVKDSGDMIPGHGGVLDRFDSIFFTAPTMFYLYLFFY